MQDSEIEKILDNFAVLNKMYDHICFVDPVTKRVLTYENSIFKKTDLRCHDYWGKNEICDNCISIRAHNEKKSFVKLEYTPNSTYMITAVPIELSDRSLVIELMKDMTDSMVIENRSGQYQTEVCRTVDSLNNLISRDKLTGLYNRRYIDERMPVDIINAALTKKSLAIIMTDIDFFKNVNDEYGHLVGDEVLKSFADTLLSCIKRESDWVSRYGGEEFLICLTGAKMEKALEIAENMRKAVESKTIVSGSNSINITASFGICCLDPEVSNLNDYIKCADKNLYEAKRTGRNRVVPNQ